MSTSSEGADRRVVMLGEAWFESRPGGMNRYFRDLHHALVRTGTSVTGVAFGAPPTDAPGAISCGPLGAPLPLRLLRYARAARRSLRRSGPAVVDCHFALYAALLIASGALRELPLVVHFHGPWAAESAVAVAGRPVQAWLKRSLERFVYRRADAVVVLSAAFRDIVVQQYGVAPTKVHVIPPGVDLDRFTPTPRHDARRRLSIPADRFVVVAVRRLDPRMGLDVLLEAWAELERAGVDATLLVAGSGRELPALDARRRTLARPEHVRFLGRVEDDDLPSLYSAADCSVVPTRSLEGFGLVVLESLASGTAAIVTDVGGLPDGVRALDPSLVVAPEDAMGLATRLRQAASGDLPGPEACVRHARTFDWPGVAATHNDLFRSLGAEPIRVAFVDHCAALSGAELALSRLIPALEVSPLVILGEHGPLEARLRERGVDVQVLPLPTSVASTHRDQVRVSFTAAAKVWSSGRYVIRLAQALRKADVDLVHTNSLKAALYGGLAARLTRTPVVWHVRDRIADDYLPRQAVTMIRLLARILPTAVIANSQATLRTVGTPGHVVPSPILAPAGARRAPHSGFSLGVVGRIAPWKGQDLFLRAFARAFADREDVRGRIIGAPLFGQEDEDFLEALRRLCSELGLDGRITFDGHLDPVPYWELDVLVHASVVPEPFGQVVGEGMAAGLPVLAARAGGPAELIVDGQTGVLYAMGDADDLATAMRRLADDPELRRRLGAQAAGALEELTPEAVAHKVMDVYAEVLWRR